MKPDIICGIDEAGRGPLAGPVSAAAVILPKDFSVEILNDSKKLSHNARQSAYKIITENSFWALAWAWPAEIDTINILNASLLAMTRAFDLLCNRYKIMPTMAIVDGNKKPSLPCQIQAIVKADATIHEVMAASIIAKVSRDKLMQRYDIMYPQYGYAKHKGYPCKAHIQACIELGASEIQRTSFNYKKAAP